MELCTNLQNRVIDLEKTKTSQAQEITSLKRRVKRLDKKGGSRTYGLKILYKVGLSRIVESFEDEGLGKEDASKQGRMADIDADAGINLVSTHFDDDTDMFGVHDLVGDEVVVETEVAFKDMNLKQGTITTTTVATTITAASTRPKAKGLDKGKDKMVEPEPVKKLSKKDQLMLDEKLAFKLQAKKEEEERLAREKAQQIEEANIVSWDNVQKSKLFVQLLEARKKQFAAIRAKEKRKNPPTKAQKRNTMSTYLKNMAGYKHNQLKNKSFDDIQKLFDKAMKRVNTFVDMETELVKGSEVRAEAEIVQESSSKSAGTELEQKSIKKQKVDEDKETAELQRLIEVVRDKEEVGIDVIPLATKPPSIVDYKIHKEGKKTYY
ncbi:hypothetical protein Tco_1246339 [Tanacetum coccineum]